MDRMTSVEFRKRYASLREAVIVTVLGRPIGVWAPVDVDHGDAWQHVETALSGGVSEPYATISPPGFNARAWVPVDISPPGFNTRPFTPVPKKGQ